MKYRKWRNKNVSFWSNGYKCMDSLCYHGLLCARNNIGCFERLFVNKTYYEENYLY